MKRPGFDLQQKSIKKSDKIKALGFVQKQPAEEEKKKKNDDSQQQAGSSKKRSREDSDEDILRDDIAIDVENLATKYPIVDWKTRILTENFMYYQIIRADGSSKNYKIFSKRLNDFDRQDCEYGSRLVEERVHVLLMYNGISIHMMLEKQYPLIQEMLSKMLSRILEVDHESEMAFELL
ncbi:hypothetical protein Tco_1131097, partial [Tanacetum coccineum]